MGIDPHFASTRELTGTENGLRVWGEQDPPVRLGIHGTHVAVDYDICVADGACLRDCPVDVFTWVDTPGHPSSEQKVEPTREDQCIDCMLCVDICPVDAIDVDASRERRID